MSKEDCKTINYITLQCICKDVGLAANARKTKYMEVGRHRANEHVVIGVNSYERVKTFKYWILY